MPTVLVAECKLEISSFNPVPTRYADFTVRAGEEILRYHRTVRSEVGGALDALGERTGLRVVATTSARAMTSGGLLAGADWQRLAREFVEGLRAAPTPDGVYLALHGAMAAEGEDDCEGHLLAETRRVLGERVPVVVSLDLHGILTERMLALADALVVYHTYPHVDFAETGARAARLLLRLVAGEVRPVTASVEVPALVRGDELITETGAVRHVIAAARALEASPGGLSAAMLWGNPFTDVPDLRSYSVAVTDGDAGRAEREAVRLAELFWVHRQAMQVPLTGLSEAVRIARETTSGTVVLVDAADAPSSGAAGDSNAILRALVEGGCGRRALIPIVDAPAVRAATAAGVGGTVRTTVGGSLDPGRFRPLPVEARVRLLSDGVHESETARHRWEAGPTAVLEAGPLTLVVTSRPVSLYDRALFLAHGQDPRRFDLVVVKSPHCEPHMFRAWAARLVDVDAPGATSANLRRLGHRRVRRPVFPLDERVPFEPRARLFRRG